MNLALASNNSPGERIWHRTYNLAMASSSSPQRAYTGHDLNNSPWRVTTREASLTGTGTFQNFLNRIVALVLCPHLNLVYAIVQLYNVKQHVNHR
ncbi:hypothetical protein QL285_027721 [Trifolium repens]|nr:hypothetical protein QL285_027721 [Trifolium repens]